MVLHSFGVFFITDVLLIDQSAMELGFWRKGSGFASLLALRARREPTDEQREPIEGVPIRSLELRSNPKSKAIADAELVVPGFTRPGVEGLRLVQLAESLIDGCTC
mmetsp:Transcript_115585/g.162476  ORF Transcript_115585/g.162476 Transcript_115585/m.162476 type:complete len:106 (-) Transcript_115585:256-573(-)